MKRFVNILILVCITLITGCKSDPEVPAKYRTRYVVLLTIDGARWSETWGDSTHANIPNRYQVLRPQGVLLTAFRNNGPTLTLSSHAAMTSGRYQSLDNSGAELPAAPSFFQRWRSFSRAGAGQTWIVSSKDKMEVLANCTDTGWKDRFLPLRDCGVNGNHSGYREDSITMRKALSMLSSGHPALSLIHFREPDFSAHSGDWPAYLAGIRSTDAYALQLWRFLQADPLFRDKTTLIITNDHGRHLDGILDGFKSHGDDCEGCRHIELLAIGPDFRSGLTLTTPYELTDICATVARLAGLPDGAAPGHVMTDLFIHP